MALLAVADALARVLDGIVPLASETVAIEQASGRVLAADLTARLTQPPFDASSMDGYAVRASDVATLPATLKVIGEAAAGCAFAGTVGSGEAVRIFTGAPVPAGAAAIVIQENTRRDASSVIVHDGRPDPDHIRRKGFDFKSGDTLLTRGRTLDARALTLAATMGHGDLAVTRRPRVAILATGNELVAPGTTPGADQIISSNSLGLAAIVEAAGGDPLPLGIARDDRADLTAKFQSAATADILVTIGGASVGDHDLVKGVLEAEGVTLGFWKIAMRPGKPMLFGHRAPPSTQRVLGLPGNPVSCLITARVFLVPLIRVLLGQSPEPLPTLEARLTHALAKNGDREHYMRAILAQDLEGRRTVSVEGSQDSSLISVLAGANALVVRSAGAPALPAGAIVAVTPLDF